MEEEQIQMTIDGMNKLEAELRHLIDVEQPDVIAALTAARAQGDLSENADYDAARDRQAKIEERIKEIEHIKDVAVIVISKDTSEELKANITDWRLSLSNPELSSSEKDELSKKIDEATRILNTSVIASNTAFLDDRVTYLDLSDNTEHTVGLVGTVSANPMAKPFPLVSDKSPLGAALIGTLPGDEKDVVCVKPYKIKVLTLEKGKAASK